MMNTDELANWLDDQYDPTHHLSDAAAELRRLQTQNAELLAALVESAALANAYANGFDVEFRAGLERVCDDARAAIEKANGN